MIYWLFPNVDIFSYLHADDSYLPRVAFQTLYIPGQNLLKQPSRCLALLKKALQIVGLATYEPSDSKQFLLLWVPKQQISFVLLDQKVGEKLSVYLWRAELITSEEELSHRTVCFT